MKVLVCGGRNFADVDLLWSTLDRIHCAKGIDYIIEGGAKGADKLARQWAAETEKVQIVTVPANWLLGKSAGPIRNQAMLGLKPDLVVAFPGGRGTADMVARAEKARIRVVKKYGA